MGNSLTSALPAQVAGFNQTLISHSVFDQSLFSLVTKSVPTLRMNPFINKDYFKLRMEKSPIAKVPAIDSFWLKGNNATSEQFVWNNTGPLIQSHYDDYNLNYNYWDDDSRNAAVRIDKDLSGDATLGEQTWLDYSARQMKLDKDSKKLINDIVEVNKESIKINKSEKKSPLE